MKIISYLWKRTDFLCVRYISANILFITLIKLFVIEQWSSTTRGKRDNAPNPL